MRRGTTPTLSVWVDADLSGFDAVYLTLRSPTAEVDKTGDALTVSPSDGGCTVSATLAQADTLAFSAGEMVDVQVRARKGDRAVATDVGQLLAERVLKEGEI